MKRLDITLNHLRTTTAVEKVVVDGIVKLINDIILFLRQELKKAHYVKDNQNLQLLIKDINDLLDHVKLLYDEQLLIGIDELISVMKNSIDMVNRVTKVVYSLKPITGVERVIVSGIKQFLELGSVLLQEDLDQVLNSINSTTSLVIY